MLGIIYSENENNADEYNCYALENLDTIVSVIKDITFFVQEKWKIATDRPGSGNTKNIGSVLSIGSLINGTGKFAELDECVFDDYWMNYLTPDMARMAELSAPYYNDIKSYKKFRNIK